MSNYEILKLKPGQKLLRRRIKEEKKGNLLQTPFLGLQMEYDKLLYESIMSESEFINREMPERDYIIKPWLQPGTLALIYAGPGVGKTWFAMSIAVAVTRQMSIGSWTVITPVDCLYIDGEMAVYEFHKRLKGLSASAQEKKSEFKIISASDSIANGREAPNLTKKSWRRRIYDFLESNRSFKLLILDNLASLVPGISENTKADWDVMNQWLISLRALGVAVIFLHHTTKKGDQRGTSARLDNIDISINLERPKGFDASQGAMFEVKFQKNRNLAGHEAQPFLFQIVNDEDSGEFFWEVGQVRKTLAPFIIEMIGCGVKQSEIAKLLKCSGANVTNIKKRAIDRGYLDDNGKLTENGIKTFGVRTFEEIMEDIEKD